jgi:hypothetical protein
VVTLAAAALTGSSLAGGVEHWVFYPLGAAAVMAVWALGGAWVAPRDPTAP